MSTTTSTVDAAPRPPKPTVTYRDGWHEHIPAELKERAQWCVWRYEWVEEKGKGKWDKPPYQAKRPQTKASSTNPSTWSDFAGAMITFNHYRNGEYYAPFDGIGYIFTSDDPYVGVDFDHCLDEDRNLLPWAKPYLDPLRKGHLHVSPSGRGIKTIVRATLPGKGNKKTGLGPNGAAIEFYNWGRYFTITGDPFDGSPDVVADLGDVIADMHGQFFPPKAEATTRAKADTGGILPDDEALLAKARTSQNGPAFCALFDRGDTSGHDGDQSRADLALCGDLAWWWGLDAAAVDRMFRRSALMRDKWDERRGDQSYGQRTIAKALEGKTEHYNPPKPRVKSKADGGKGKPPEKGKPAAPADERPEIEINTERHLVVAEAIQAITRDPDLYSRGNALVSVVQEERNAVSLTGKTELKGMAGTPKIIELSDAVIGCVLTRNACFYQWKPDKSGSGEMVAVAAHPSDWVIRAVATYKHWKGIRKLTAIAECPFPRPDGTIVEQPGYDRETMTLFAPAISFLAVPKNPTQKDAIAAWGRLSEVVKEFPFASEDDRAVFLAGLLTVLARPAITGPVPGIAVVGNKAGCGKGLLIDSIGLIAHGRIVPTSNYPGDKDEAAKVKVSIARGAFTIIHFDNVEEGTSYGTSALDSSITSMAVNDRILGSSEHTGDLTLRPAWFLSGNNISPGKDAHRRWLPCNLFTEHERPEERADIKVKDLKAHILSRRAELVRDALTILRAHAVASRPVGQWAPLGSFEEWDTVVRGAVWFATGRDCNATRRKAADDAPARQAKLALLIGWSELPEGTKLGITAAKAVELVDKSPGTHDTLRNALMHFGRDGKLATGKSLGYLLRGMRGNLMDGMKFVETDKEHGAVRWKVEIPPPKTPFPPVEGLDGLDGEDQTSDLAGCSQSHNYVITKAHDTQTSLGSGESSSPSNPSNPGPYLADQPWSHGPRNGPPPPLSAPGPDDDAEIEMEVIKL